MHKNSAIKKAANVLKKQVFLYDSDLERLQKAYKNSNTTAKDILTSFLRLNFFLIFQRLKEK